MSDDEAIHWIQQVDGRLFHTANHERDVWVALVRVPRIGARTRVIVGLGDSIEEATVAAERQWQSLWGAPGVVH